MSRKPLFFDFEHYKQPLASQEIFVRRMVRCVWLAFLLMAIVLFIASAVYHNVEGFSWLDSELNAMAVMTGLGLVNTLDTATGKIFTSFYALFSSIIFYLVLAIIFSPLIHRFSHKFHLETDRKEDE